MSIPYRSRPASLLQAATMLAESHRPGEMAATSVVKFVKSLIRWTSGGLMSM
jgi:hypothetical protein